MAWVKHLLLAPALSTLAKQGKKVLLISTASNLDDLFETTIRSEPTPVNGVPGLLAANLDPEQAASDYRDQVVGPYRDTLPQEAIQQIEEQLSGACTVEIAAFDEFTKLLSTNEHEFYHIVFDTAPTGHTLRLSQLPKAWTGFMDTNIHGASCLGPLSGMSAKQEMYTKTVEALSDSKQTILILVARPERQFIVYLLEGISTTKIIAADFRGSCGTDLTIIFLTRIL